MNPRNLLLLPALLLLLIPGGCMSSHRSSAPSSEPLLPGSYVEIGPARGSASVFKILGIALGDADSLDQRAMDDAIAKSGGDALVRVSLKEKSCGICLVGTHGVSVKATAVKKNE